MTLWGHMVWFHPTCWIGFLVNGEANTPNVFVMAQSNTQHETGQGSLTEASLLQPEEWLNTSLPPQNIQLETACVSLRGMSFTKRCNGGTFCINFTRGNYVPHQKAKKQLHQQHQCLQSLPPNSYIENLWVSECWVNKRFNFIMSLLNRGTSSHILKSHYCGNLQKM